MDLDAAEVRVLGCLVEKQRTTPAVYPLSLNALRAACNQSTARDPIADYEDDQIRDALHRLARRRWTRMASGARAAKYRHLLDETLEMPRDEQAVLAVLALRGAQTPNELRQRVERLQSFPDHAAFQAALDRLIGKDFAVRLERRPGQKEERYTHRLSEDLDGEAPPVAAAAPAPAREPGPTPDDGRIDRLEAELAILKAQLTEVREELGLDT